MKYQFQIVGNKQFEYIMGEGEFETVQSAVEAYKSLTEAYTTSSKPLEGLSDKQLDDVIKKMMLGISIVGGTELWSHATPAQKLEINRVKRLLKQIKAKGEEPEVDYGEGTNGDGQS